MRLPIDTQTVKFAAAGPAEPVLDYETRAPKLDENGTALFNVPLFAAGSGVKDSITVKVSGEPKGLSEFTPVKITNLIATTWEVGTNHGVSFRAERIELLKASA
ncbi:MAG: hypothetical protein ACYDB2_01540 [Acidimicrobiales bacterium]|jgi:hypothetical protein